MFETVQKEYLSSFFSPLFPNISTGIYLLRGKPKYSIGLEILIFEGLSYAEAGGADGHVLLTLRASFPWP